MLYHAIQFFLATLTVGSALIFLGPTAPAATVVVVVMTLAAFGAGQYAKHRRFG